MELRTRFLTKLTNYEVERYLDNNDIIIIPVGTVEMHGALPLDCETVLPEAFALKMAEKIDGLILPNLQYFYAGGTVIGRGTVQVSNRAGIDYLGEIAKSLLRQGFKRQIYISFHSPAHMTCAAMVRDFFDDTKVPILYIDLITVLRSALSEEMKNPDENMLNSIFFAGYDILDKLEEIPLTNTPEMDFSGPHTSTVDFFSPKLSKLAGNSESIGYYFGKAMDHAPTPRIETPDERQKYADMGMPLFEKILEEIDLEEIVKLMKDIDTFTQNDVINKFGEWLPETKF